MSITKIDHVKQGLGRLLEQFKGKDNIEKIVTVYMKALQDAEDELFDLLQKRSVDVATGVHLDHIGQIVNEPRKQRGDEEYRIAILFKILVNTSEGTRNQILQGLKLITQADTVKIWDHYPVSYVLYTDGPTIPQGTIKALQNASPASSGPVQVLHDPDKNVFTPASLRIIPESFLETGDGDTLITGSGDDIVVKGYTVDDPEGKAQLAELGFDVLELDGETGFLVDNNGDNVLDNNGDNILYSTGPGGNLEISTNGSTFSTLEVLNNNPSSVKGVFAEVYKFTGF